MNLKTHSYNEMSNILSNLKSGWDGYNGLKIKKEVLDKFNDMEYISKLMKLFDSVGFKQCDVEIIPTSMGEIQLEAENETTYLEITIK